MATGRNRRRPPSILDVAAAAGVSHQTVSRVLNKSANVAEHTREKVQAAIEALGYRRNSVARALVTRRSGVIGIVTTTSWHYGPTSILLSVEIAARAAGYYTVVAPIDDEAEVDEVARALDDFLGLPVEGLVFIAPTRDIARDLQGISLPVPMVAVTSAQIGAMSGIIGVHIAQEGGADAVMDHLLGLGHRDIAHVAGPDGAYEARIRESVWRAGLAERGLTVREPLGHAWDCDSGYEAGRVLVKEGLPTAVFCANDELALGLYRAFAESGVRIPEDVSVVGFDDLPSAPFYVPPLTTVAQDFEALGEQIVAALKEALAGESLPQEAHLPTRLVVRGSTAAPRHA
ncbi:LacI family DNA-binding transcriptional regulator [Schaalia sp. 19OD2882]|uniref:LacI family DNA-binding transcriptional regulator n=1 Tax=Schaalia sp. 19OD2882 TaxID=2794089 RepID=UPI001C1EEBA6|nr:LacI family DNA-binding transcriptional regulator [Schaalia sp. 19OD2882]QWW20166.1 LacI family DNA-binding transcriptional regulator [Schaalia sp. 19OD2882]